MMMGPADWLMLQTTHLGLHVGPLDIDVDGAIGALRLQVSLFWPQFVMPCTLQALAAEVAQLISA